MVKKLPIRVRMKTVIQALKEGNKTYTELLKLGVPEKTLDRILKDYLEYLGLARKDGVYWVWYENKKVFQSKHDYDIALKHSRYLTLSTSDKQRLDQANPALALDLLVYYDKANQDIDNQCLFQHIKTGYYEVYSLMQKYRQMMDEAGLSEIPRLPKLPSLHLSFYDETHEAYVPRNYDPKNSKSLMNVIPMKGDMLMIDVGIFGFPSHNEHNIKYVHKKKYAELIDLRDLLVGKIYSILNDVRNGIPLRGYCDYCPDRRITIKSKS